MMSVMLVMWPGALWVSVVSCVVLVSQESMHAADFVDVRRRWALLKVVSSEISRVFLWLLYLRAWFSGTKYFLSSAGMVCGGGWLSNSVSC